MTSTREKPKLVILGTSLFAPEVLDLVTDTGEFEVTAFIENWDREKAGSLIQGIPVIWIDEAPRLASSHLALCSLGTTRRKNFIRDVADMGFPFATVFHPSARVSRTSDVNKGSLVSAGVFVAAHTDIGCHVILNRGVLVGHNTTISDYVTVSPGANIAGAISIGEGAYIGMGATILDRITVGEGAVVGAGSLVTRDVPPHTQVMGLPARVIKENVDGR